VFTSSPNHYGISACCIYSGCIIGNVVGLSKLNRVVEHFGRRGAIQEQLTVAIHHAIDELIEDNKGVAVMIEATHNCVQCRGVKHGGASMQTSKLSGAFTNDDASRAEFYKNIELSNKMGH
jgi:GTP cyclohydrolase IA